MESLHPNYWAQLGLRNCLRQFWNDGAVRTGSCWPTGGISNGEPNMTIKALPDTSAPLGSADEFTVNGTLDVGGRGVLDNDGYRGTDTFSYRPADFYGQGEVTLVTLTVTGSAKPVVTAPAFTG